MSKKPVTLITGYLGSGKTTLLNEILRQVEQAKKECLENDEELRKNWDPEYGDRINQVVFIGKNYDKAKIINRLEQCLA